MTTKGTLPITEMIEVYIKERKEIRGASMNQSYNSYADGWEDGIYHILEKVRPIEQSQIQKAKEDERSRIVWVLEEKLEQSYEGKVTGDGSSYEGGKRDAFQEAIDLIRNNLNPNQ